MTKPPNGFDEIKAFYGWKDSYLLLDGTPSASWETENMVLIPLPAPLALSWNKEVNVTKVKLNKACAGYFKNFLEAVHFQGLWHHLNPYGGGYAWRLKRVSHKLSLHAFGGAMDFNPQHNGQIPGTVTDWEVGAKPFAMPLSIVEIARECGIKWGGDFDDPMHFQYGTGF